jgi:hypothetical protein
MIYNDVKPILIFSVYRSNYTSDQNRNVHNTILSGLQLQNIQYKELFGRYNKTLEKSILVLHNEHNEEIVKHLCKQFSQDCYLYSDSTRQTTLIYPDKKEQIGTLKPVSSIAGYENYTLDEETNTFWITE